MELKKLYPRWVNHLATDHWLAINDQQILTVLKFSLLHRSSLVDLFGVDKIFRPEVNWILTSYAYELRYQLRTINHQLITSSWLWSSANWLERELWEMFGVNFVGHSDLRRLLTDYGFRGYPLLKSYPLIGYHQLAYSEKNKRITAQPVVVSQEFREFDFQSPWLA